MMGEWWAQSGAMAIYRLDGYTDSSGNGNTLADVGIYGATDFTRYGKFGLCAWVPTDQKDWLKSTSDNFRLIDADAGLTLACWVKMDVVGDYDMVALCNDGGTDRLSRLTYLASSGVLYFGYSTASGAAYTTTLYADTWYFIVGTHIAGSTKLYLNGALVATGNNTYVDGSNGNFRVCNSTANSRYYHGYIDEMAVFTRVLSQGEINRWYAYATGKLM